MQRGWEQERIWLTIWPTRKLEIENVLKLFDKKSWNQSWRTKLKNKARFGHSRSNCHIKTIWLAKSFEFEIFYLRGWSGNFYGQKSCELVTIHTHWIKLECQQVTLLADGPSWRKIQGTYGELYIVGPKLTYEATPVLMGNGIWFGEKQNFVSYLSVNNANFQLHFLILPICTPFAPWSFF